jgi:hypothetical protein
MTGGRIVGTPTASGTVTVTVTVTDAAGGTGTREYTLTVNPAPSITGPAALPAGAVGTAYPSTQLAATGGTGTLSWSVTGLPAGLNFNSGPRTITGIPTAGGNFTVAVTVTDSLGGVATRMYPLNILAISGPADLPDWTRNRPGYSATVTATGGTGTPTWTATGLPSGLTMNGATGQITGTPTVNGNFTVAAQVASGGLTVTRSYSMTVNQTLAIVDTTFSGKKKKDLNNQAFVTGGTTPRALTGAPSWVTLNANGTINLRLPDDPDTYVFTATVTDATGASVSAVVTVTVTN